MNASDIQTLSELLMGRNIDPETAMRIIGDPERFEGTPEQAFQLVLDSATSNMHTESPVAVWPCDMSKASLVYKGTPYNVSFRVGATLEQALRLLELWHALWNTEGVTNVHGQTQNVQAAPMGPRPSPLPPQQSANANEVRLVLAIFQSGAYPSVDLYDASNTRYRIFKPRDQNRTDPKWETLRTLTQVDWNSAAHNQRVTLSNLYAETEMGAPNRDGRSYPQIARLYTR